MDIKQKLTVRRAGHQDYEGVVSINTDLYNGLDYIPTCYHTLIDNPNIYGYVAELDGICVSIYISHWSV